MAMESGTSSDSRKKTASAGDRAVVTLSPGAAAAARKLGARMGEISLPEVVRRGLTLLDLFLSLSSEEEIVIRHKGSNELERVRFSWETFG
jgi:hypothetical protein